MKTLLLALALAMPACAAWDIAGLQTNSYGTTVLGILTNDLMALQALMDPASLGLPLMIDGAKTKAASIPAASMGTGSIYTAALQDASVTSQKLAQSAWADICHLTNSPVSTGRFDAVAINLLTNSPVGTGRFDALSYSLLMNTNTGAAVASLDAATASTFFIKHRLVVGSDGSMGNIYINNYGNLGVGHATNSGVISSSCVGGLVGGLSSDSAEIFNGAYGSIVWGEALASGRIHATGVGGMAGGYVNGIGETNIATHFGSFVWGRNVRSWHDYASALGQNISTLEDNSLHVRKLFVDVFDNSNSVPSLCFVTNAIAVALATSGFADGEVAKVAFKSNYGLSADGIHTNGSAVITVSKPRRGSFTFSLSNLTAVVSSISNANKFCSLASNTFLVYPNSAGNVSFVITNSYGVEGASVMHYWLATDFNIVESSAVINDGL